MRPYSEQGSRADQELEDGAEIMEVPLGYLLSDVLYRIEIADRAGNVQEEWNPDCIGDHR